jgi:hypothetical protein
MGNSGRGRCSHTPVGMVTTDSVLVAAMETLITRLKLISSNLGHQASNR